VSDAGFLVDYISHPVINSFTTAAAITIAASQLKASLNQHSFVHYQIKIKSKSKSLYFRHLAHRT